MELSRDINVAFKQHMAHLADNESQSMMGMVDKIDLTVNVLSIAFWPTYPVMAVHIPPYMSKYQEIFNKFYQVSAMRVRFTLYISWSSAGQVFWQETPVAGQLGPLCAKGQLQIWSKGAASFSVSRLATS